jgi:hypothetical protein
VHSIQPPSCGHALYSANPLYDRRLELRDVDTKTVVTLKRPALRNSQSHLNPCNCSVSTPRANCLAVKSIQKGLDLDAQSKSFCTLDDSPRGDREPDLPEGPASSALALRFTVWGHVLSVTSSHWTEVGEPLGQGVTPDRPYAEVE